MQPPLRLRWSLCCIVLVCAAAVSAVSAAGSTDAAAAGAAADAAAGSLAVPSNPDMTCVDVRGAGANQYRSMSCPNADWQTYAWIQTQFVSLSGIDAQLDLAFFSAAGTRLCKRWYRDLMCRYVLPRCPSTKEPRKGGPCKSECESFSKSCPGLAMSCAAFDADPAQCWTSTTQYAYGYDNAASSGKQVGAAAVAVVGAVALVMLL